MIYFDNSATTQLYPQVLDTVVKVSQQVYGNPSSLHKLGTVADRLLQQSRQQVADLLQVSPQEIVFTSGGTEGDNWVVKGTAIEKKAFGRHIITTTIEHPAVSKSMQQLEQLGFDVTYLEVDERGLISVADLKDAIREDTILVSIIAVNNEVGAVQPIQEIGDVLVDYPTIHFHIDAVQAVTEFDHLIPHPRVDFLVLSAHKFHGPRGVGIVYKKQGRRLAPLLTGGGQESGQRSTTENIAGIAATAKALRMTLEIREATKQNEGQIKDHIRQFLSSYDNVQIYSQEDGAAHILCFALQDVRGEVMVHALEEENIIISTTSACSSKKGELPATLEAMHVPAKWSKCAVRLSFGEGNTLAEANQFIQVFKQLHEKFKVIQK
ncbi:aminotransferase V [Jeotgalibaca sp. PTS2502]|uniref:cysteine desulfurase family protein n=1 Tax=Jeotgalibaca sp. PTS2502 TaxID=1903686 RepID=UPI0009739A9F|nr:cysteine desulfurase family protein [Jeotgalibaca sp. PTS2502]APZ49055.1 aminotransferase V [Jeotgalibaca sp. PTS2502]